MYVFCCKKCSRFLLIYAYHAIPMLPLLLGICSEPLVQVVFMLLLCTLELLCSMALVFMVFHALFVS